jgi:type 1 glutamine amidotransferase
MKICCALLRILLVTGQTDEPYHHWRETTPVIREGLERTGKFEVRVMEEPRGITAAALEGYDVVVLNYNGPRFPAAAESALETFVRSGHGFVAFHQAAYGEFFGMESRDRKWRAGPTSGWTAFARMIGATWEPDKIGHARRGKFQVDFRDERPCFTADDELYHRLTLDPSVRILADAMSPIESRGTGKREPQIWTNQYGAGRVFFTTLGHDKTAWFQPGMMEAFARGVEWAAQGK